MELSGFEPEISACKAEVLANYTITPFLYILGCAGGNRTPSIRLWALHVTFTPPHDISFSVWIRTTSVYERSYLIQRTEDLFFGALWTEKYWTDFTVITYTLCWGATENRTQIIGLQSRDNNHYTKAPFITKNFIVTIEESKLKIYQYRLFIIYEVTLFYNKWNKI